MPRKEISAILLGRTALSFVVVVSAYGSDVVRGQGSSDRDCLPGHWEGAFSRLGAIQTMSADFVRTNGVLAGTYDIPDLVDVPPKENVDRFRQFLHEAGNRDVSVLVIPGVKHDMESYGTLLGRKWQWPDNYWVWPRKSPLFYEGIIDWLEKQHLIQRS